MRNPLPAGILTACSVLAGCGGANVLVETTVPNLLVEPLPLTMGVHFDASLTDYVHEEELEQHGNFRIELGSTQVPVFERVFDAMFARTERVESLDAPGAAVDAIIVPVVEELQFSIPAQTRSDFFEIWIKYKIDIYQPDGELIASWPLPAYGKSNSRNFGFMESASDLGLNEATIWALRDAAAHFAFYFPRAPEIRNLTASVAERSG